MDSTTHRFYLKDGIDSRNHLDLYFSDKEEMIFEKDILRFPMVNLHYQFSSGLICGNLLLDLSKGSFIHHLFSASNVFKDIILMKFHEKSAMELRRWLGDRTGAFDWSHTKTAVEELEGKSDQNENKVLNLKASIRQIVMCTLEKENLADPVVLPLADCIITVWLLEVISKGQDDYMRNLEKFANLLKRGGHLILIGVLNSTYATAGPDKYYVFKYNESFVKSALSKAGFVIDYCAVQRRKNVSDLMDYTHVIFITAHRK